MLQRNNAPTPVLHLVDTLIMGGTERQLMEQLRSVDRRRWRPLVASLHAEGELRAELSRLDVEHTPFPLHTSLGHPNTALQIGRLALWCRKKGVRVIHAHDFYSNVIAAAAARLARVPLLVSRRDLAHWLSNMQLKVLGWACRSADRVICNARLLGDQAVSALGVDPGKVVVVPNGLDLERFDSEATKDPDPPFELRRDHNMPLVAVVSSMHLPDKGHADLLQAMGRLAEKGRRFRLVLVGDGAERPRLEKMAAELGLADRVYFLGRRKDVPRILARVDAACLPSWAEGFPNSVMEAMAARLPVVATAVGGCPELVDSGKNGILVQPRQPAALAAALDRVLADRAAAKDMGRAGRKTIQEGYSLASTTRRFEDLYATLTGQGMTHAAERAA